MMRILVVEDSRTQAEFMRGILEARSYEVVIAGDSAAALDALGRQETHAVLVDLRLPGIDGLELIGHLRKQFPRLPTILVTEYGNEDVATDALQRGAVSYIPKRRLKTDLLPTLDGILSVTKANPRHHKLLECWQEQASQFVLPNDVSLVPHLVSHLQDAMKLLNLCDDASALRVSVALSESLINAIYHGNLELDSALREEDNSAWHRIAAERLREPPHCTRRVFVGAGLSRAQAVFVIRDEGHGFDPATLPDPCDPNNLEKTFGRGLLLIRSFIDEVQHNAVGNEITLVKRRSVAH